MKNPLSLHMLRRLIACGAVFMSTSVADAAVLAQYTFSSSSVNSNDTDVNSAASTFTAGAGINLNFAALSGNTYAYTTADQTNTNAANAVTNNDYFQFTITPNSGYELDLTNLRVDYDTSYNGTARGVAVRSSVDNFTANLLNFSEASGVGTVNTFLQQNIDLSGINFQNLTATTTFRIYLFDGASQVASEDRVDNVILTGTTVAVPEPSSVALGGIALLGLMLSRSRRRGI